MALVDRGARERLWTSSSSWSRLNESSKLNRSEYTFKASDTEKSALPSPSISTPVLVGGRLFVFVLSSAAAAGNDITGGSLLVLLIVPASFALLVVSFIVAFVVVLVDSTMNFCIGDEAGGG